MDYTPADHLIADERFVVDYMAVVVEAVFAVVVVAVAAAVMVVAVAAFVVVVAVAAVVVVVASVAVVMVAMPGDFAIGHQSVTETNPSGFYCLMIHPKICYPMKFQSKETMQMILMMMMTLMLMALVNSHMHTL